MGKSIQARIDESLADTLERIRKEIADEFKKKYNLDEITIHGTLSSQIAAAKIMGKNKFNFKIRKVGLNRGILELL